MKGWERLGGLCSKLYTTTLKTVALGTSGRDICPSFGNIGRCFELTGLNECVGVIIGQDPYSDGRATGLAFANQTCDTGEEKAGVGKDEGVSGEQGGTLWKSTDAYSFGICRGGVSPSLGVIRESVMSLCENKEKYAFDYTLESWARQGILLLNSALTVVKGFPGSHALTWQPFMTEFIKSLDAHNKDLCWIFLGKTASLYSPLVRDGMVLIEKHPAYYARENFPMPSLVWKRLMEHTKDTFGKELNLYGTEQENQECKAQ